MLGRNQAARPLHTWPAMSTRSVSLSGPLRLACSDSFMPHLQQVIPHHRSAAPSHHDSSHSVLILLASASWCWQAAIGEQERGALLQLDEGVLAAVAAVLEPGAVVPHHIRVAAQPRPSVDLLRTCGRDVSPGGHSRAALVILMRWAWHAPPATLPLLYTHHTNMHTGWQHRLQARLQRRCIHT